MQKRISSVYVFFILTTFLVSVYTILIGYYSNSYPEVQVINSKIAGDISVSNNDAIYVSPTDNVQSIINSNPAGTTYIFEEGIYRMITISPKSGDTLIGEYGAVLNGSKLLDVETMKIENGTGKGGINLYYFENQTQYSNPEPSSPYQPGSSGTDYICKEGYMRCNYNEDLFIDDEFLIHATSKNDVEPGKWFFDYSNDRIYLADNPSGKKIETSVTPYAIVEWGRDNITFKNFIVEKYATPAQRHAVELMGNNSLVEYNEIRLNHGGALKIGNNGIARYSYIYRNGQIGLGGRSDGAVFEYNEVSHNNQLGFEVTWEAGGSKWARATNLIIRNNYSHNNDGPGFWTDIDNVNVLYEDNIVVNNSKHGIQHEISFDGIIRDNFSGYNGTSDFEGKQIYVHVSQNVDVYNNTVVTNADNLDGLIVQNYPRGNSTVFDGVKWQVLNVDVYDNELYHGISDRQIIGFEASNSVESDMTFDNSKDEVRFYRNSYCVDDLNGYFWNYGPYGDAHKQFSYFQSQGQDTEGTITSNCSIPNIPEWNIVTGQVQDLNDPQNQEGSGSEGTGGNNGFGGGSNGTILNIDSCEIADGNNDGIVNKSDLDILSSYYNQECFVNECINMDVNQDNSLTLVDFTNLASYYNKSCN